MSRNRLFKAWSIAAVAALALSACATSDANEGSAPGKSVTVEDNNGAQTISLPLTSVVATDNRTFETLSDWGVELSAAAVALMPNTIAYTKDADIIDLGNHREPNLEAVVAVDPQLIINGQRFADFHKDFAELVPDAVVLELDPREGQPFDAELKRQTTVLGEIFGKQAEAKKLNDDLDAAIARAKAAYTAGDKVMGVNVSGGEIGYVAPSNGRTLGPLFDILGLTPALEVEGSDDHQGDDISVEAIADSNPDIILVMDRDAAVAADEATYQPAAQVIEGSEALKNVNAVKNGNVIYMPNDTYTNEGIQTYTEFLNMIAEQLEAAQ
ncbi:siderophore ABC transporter substrate-binding protein [Timonella senegalensis]|uniref:siderophore ABC transporter substrate-binding protein n=1 Tax=Timonella senegalensis TaxID=1465825 RepID=UPI0028AF96D1|nr:ABC transporter substrate-binding protein [Timonella senegalensis]